MNDASNELLSRTAWLYTKVLEGPFFFIDLWSLAHLYSGFFVMLVLLAGRARRPWTWLVAALVAYELVELAFIYVAFHAFRPETLKDQVTDVVVGALGGLLAVRLARRSATLAPPARARVARHGAATLMAVAIAFEWVGHYGYRYSRPLFNSPGLSWWAFLLWTLGLVAVAEGYAFFEALLDSRLKALAVTALGYGAALGIVEYVGYAVLEIREVGHPGRAALALDLVHGTRALHAFYLGAPWLGVLAFVGLRHLLDRAAAGAATRAEAEGARGTEAEGEGPGPTVDGRQERPILTP